MSRDRSRSRSPRRGGRGDDRDDGAQRCSILVRNLPLDTRYLGSQRRPALVI